MSRFIDVSNTRTITTSCGCDGKPHDEDRVEIFAEVPYGVVGQMTAAGYDDNPKAFNRVAAQHKLAELCVRGWNLHGPNGREMPVDKVTIRLLDATTLEWICTEINKGFKPVKLPKGSPAGSPNGSSETPSQTPETAGTTSSTTSS